MLIRRSQMSPLNRLQVELSGPPSQLFKPENYRPANDGWMTFDFFRLTIPNVAFIIFYSWFLFNLCLHLFEYLSLLILNFWIHMNLMFKFCIFRFWNKIIRFKHKENLTQENNVRHFMFCCSCWWSNGIHVHFSFFFKNAIFKTYIAL